MNLILKMKKIVFLLLEINIPLLDDIKLKSEIKNNICFFDFPGHNTSNNLFY